MFMIILSSPHEINVITKAAYQKKNHAVFPSNSFQGKKSGRLENVFLESHATGGVSKKKKFPSPLNNFSSDTFFWVAQCMDSFFGLPRAVPSLSLFLGQRTFPRH